MGKDGNHVCIIGKPLHRVYEEIGLIKVRVQAVRVVELGTQECVLFTALCLIQVQLLRGYEAS